MAGKALAAVSPLRTGRTLDLLTKDNYFLFWTIVGSQWLQAQILSRWPVGANGHGDLLREPLRPPYRRHFQSSVDLASPTTKAHHKAFERLCIDFRFGCLFCVCSYIALRLMLHSRTSQVYESH